MATSFLFCRRTLIPSMTTERFWITSCCGYISTNEKPMTSEKSVYPEIREKRDIQTNRTSEISAAHPESRPHIHSHIHAHIQNHVKAHQNHIEQMKIM